MSKSQWSDELMERVRSATPPGTQYLTLTQAKPNLVVDVTEDGVLVHTERSMDAGQAQLVPGWMMQVAWDHLQRFGSLTNSYLLEELNVKRSSAVCTLLAQLPEVAAKSSRPIELVLVTAGGS